MAVDAVKAVRKTDLSIPSPPVIHSDGKARYPIENIGIIKAHGQSALESELVDGLVLAGSRAAQGMPLRVSDARVLVLDFPLQRYKTQMGVEVKVSDPDRLEEIKREEEAITRRQMERVLATGANVVVCGHAIDDLCLKYLVEAGAIGLRRVGNDDLIRVSKATQATIVVVAAARGFYVEHERPGGQRGAGDVRAGPLRVCGGATTGRLWEQGRDDTQTTSCSSRDWRSTRTRACRWCCAARTT